MYSHISHFFQGGLDPTWPHIALIGGTVIGGALVGLGVILEAEKWFSAPTIAVFIGIVIEAACTLLLFGFDEGISSAQKSKIAALELKLVSRAVLLADHEDAVIRKLNHFQTTKFELGLDLGSSEQNALAHKLEVVLADKAKWTHVDWDGGSTVSTWVFSAGGGPPAPRWAPVIATNVEIHVFDEYRTKLEPAVAALVSALKEAGIDAADAGPSGVISKNRNAIHIWIGDKQYDHITNSAETLQLNEQVR